MSKILIADDSPTIQKVVKITLANQNHDLDIAPSEDDCLQKVANKDFDLVLLDYGLSKNKSPDELLSEIKARQQKCKVFALLGAFDDCDLHKLKKSGFVDAIKKPFDSGDFLSRCNAILFGEETSKEKIEDEHDDLISKNLDMIESSGPEKPSFDKIETIDLVSSEVFGNMKIQSNDSDNNFLSEGSSEREITWNANDISSEVNLFNDEDQVTSNTPNEFDDLSSWEVDQRLSVESESLGEDIEFAHIEDSLENELNDWGMAFPSEIDSDFDRPSTSEFLIPEVIEGLKNNILDEVDEQTRSLSSINDRGTDEDLFGNESTKTQDFSGMNFRPSEEQNLPKEDDLEYPDLTENLELLSTTSKLIRLDELNGADEESGDLKLEKTNPKVDLSNFEDTLHVIDKDKEGLWVEDDESDVEDTSHENVVIIADEMSDDEDFYVDSKGSETELDLIEVYQLDEDQEEPSDLVDQINVEPISLIHEPVITHSVFNDQDVMQKDHFDSGIDLGFDSKIQRDDVATLAVNAATQKILDELDVDDIQDQVSLNLTTKILENQDMVSAIRLEMMDVLKKELPLTLIKDENFIEQIKDHIFRKIKKEILDDVSRKIEKVLWEVIPDLAENIIRNEINDIKKEVS